MHNSYHQEVVFQDFAFVILEAKHARDIWEMLIKKSQDQLEIRFSNIT
jgi:phenylalanyl-tRNA synthetase beta subunit